MKEYSVAIVVCCLLLFFHSSCQAVELFLPSNVTWYACPMFSSSPHPVYGDNEQVKRTFPSSTTPFVSITQEARKLIMAECAFVNVPLDYNDQTTGQTIQVFMKRYRQNGVGRKSVWMLEGGPGAPSTVAFEDTFIPLAKLLPDFDVYAIDHRGVGSSNRLGCVAGQAETTGSEGGILIMNSELAGCSAAFQEQYGLHSSYFSPTQAAWDIITLMSYMKQDAGYVESHLYGVSYGTFLVSRFLQICEANNLDIATTASLDGVVSTSSGTDNPDEPRRLQFSNWDHSMDVVGRYILETYCHNHTVCYSKLGKNPVEYMIKVFHKLYNETHCPAIVERLPIDKLRMVLGQMLTRLKLRELLPAVLYRLNRCDPTLDIPSLTKLLDIVDEANMTDPTRYPAPQSLLVHLTIAGSEMYPRNLSAISYDELYNIFNQTHIATGNYRKYLQLESANWPLYTPDQYFNKAPKPKIPTLLLNGDADAQTTLASAQYQSENMGPDSNHRLIVIPYAPHAVLWTSPQHNASHPQCGMEIFTSFLKGKNLNEIDTSCLNRLVPITFNGDKDTNLMYLGAANIYDGAYSKDDTVLRVKLSTLLVCEAFTLGLSVVIIASLAYYIASNASKLRESQ